MSETVGKSLERKYVRREYTITYGGTSLEEHIGWLNRMAKEATAEGYINLRVTLYDSDNEESARIAITGERLETEHELKQRAKAELLYIESRKQQYLLLQREFGDSMER